MKGRKATPTSLRLPNAALQAIFGCAPQRMPRAGCGVRPIGLILLIAA